MPIHRDEKGPYGRGQHQIVRIARAVRGEVHFTLTCRPAIDFGRRPHRVILDPRGAVFDSDGIDLGLISPIPLRVDGTGVTAEFTLAAGETATFVLRQVEDWTASPDLLANVLSGDDALDRTVAFWRDWIGRCRYQGRWREIVQRSALVLKLLTFGAHRRDRRGRDHQLARGDRRRAQLGLSLHLDPRRGLHPLCIPAPRLCRRGPGFHAMAPRAHHRGGRTDRPDPDHLWNRRPARAHRGGAAPPRRVRGLASGPDRQCGDRAAPARHLWRADRRDLPL